MAFEVASFAGGGGAANPAVARRRWSFWVAHLLGAWLDEKLAVGVAPDSNALLAARAQLLVAPRRRRELADNWLDLLIDARRPLAVLSPSVPVVRRRIIDARAQIQALADALRMSMPTSRGVAMARSLLTDGSGPIYNPASARDLASSVSAIVRQLNPLLSRD